jgi:hypothetical protein
MRQPWVRGRLGRENLDTPRLLSCLVVAGSCPAATILLSLAGLWKNCGKLFPEPALSGSFPKKKEARSGGPPVACVAKGTTGWNRRKGKKDGISEFYVLEHNLGNLVCVIYVRLRTGSFSFFFFPDNEILRGSVHRFRSASRRATS